MSTYPNQKIIHINKPKYDNNFLQVSNDEIRKAYRELNAAGFALYFYLAGNCDGFDLILSRQNAMEELGISKDTYHRGIKQLEQAGYIVSNEGNVYNFYTSNVSQNCDCNNQNDGSNSLGVAILHTSSRKNDTIESQNCIHQVAKLHTEIDKIDNINKNIEVVASNPDAVSGIYNSFNKENHRKIKQIQTLKDDDNLCGKLAKYSKCTKEEIIKNVPDLCVDLEELVSYLETYSEEANKEYYNGLPNKDTWNNYWEFLKIEFDYYKNFSSYDNGF